jgi:predicted esterase
VIERTIATTTHGRYLVAPPAAKGPAPLLVGFHGYAEGAEAQLERMRAIPGADPWRIVAIQGLHRFYQRRANDVVASWMTRQDRELAIADNLAYVQAVIDAVAREWPDPPKIVYAGFSQGVAMTFRAAAASTRRVAGVIAVGGDVPPELDAASLAGIPAALICRGAGDAVYTTSKFDSDIGRLRAAGAAVTPLAFDGGHEWAEPVLHAAAAFLRDRTTAPALSEPPREGRKG